MRLLWDQNAQHWNIQINLKHIWSWWLLFKYVLEKRFCFYEIQISLCHCQNFQLQRSMFMYVFLLLNGNTHLFLYRFYTCMLLFIIIVCIFLYSWICALYMITCYLFDWYNTMNLLKINVIQKHFIDSCRPYSLHLPHLHFSVSVRYVYICTWTEKLKFSVNYALGLNIHVL